MAMAARTIERADRLGLTGSHVFFNEGWVDYDKRQGYLLEADIGVSTHLDHVETAFSFRTRLLDCLWTSLPMVVTRGDGFAELIEDRGLGLTVPPDDVEALEQALFRLLADGELRMRCREAITAVAPGFTWSSAMQPLLLFCRTPRRAPDLVHPSTVATRWVVPSTREIGSSGLRSDFRRLVRHLGRGEFGLVVDRVRGRLQQGSAGKHVEDGKES